MKWINEPQEILATRDTCTFKLCGDRSEPCRDKNVCGYNSCAKRYCVINL